MGVVHIKEEETTDDYHYLDNYSDESKRLMLSIVKDTYSFEVNRTRDIENKASNTIGFVGFIFSLTVVALTTILVNADDIMRCKIFFASIVSPIIIFSILSLMVLSIGFGIKVISIKEWKNISLERFLSLCTNVSTTDNKLLENILVGHNKIVRNNIIVTNKMASDLQKSHICFILSLCIVTLYFMYILEMYMNICC